MGAGAGEFVVIVELQAARKNAVRAAGSRLMTEAPRALIRAAGELASSFTILTSVMRRVAFTELFVSASLSHSRFHATGRTRPSVDAVWRSGLAASIFSTRRHCTGRSRSLSRSLPNRCRTAVPGRERHVRRRRLDVAGASAAPTVVAATAAAGPPASSAADDDPVGEPVATLDAYEPTIGFPSGSDTATFTNCTVKAACSVNELLPCHDHV